jgi:fatty acid desaturase
MVVEQRTYQQPSVNSLVKQLINDVNDLFRQHIELFRQEIKEDATAAARYTSIAIGGALVAYTSLIFFGFFLIFVLALIMPLWASALIVTVFYTIISAIAIIIARNQLKHLKMGTEEAVDETKKTAEEAKRWLHDLR